MKILILLTLSLFSLTGCTSTEKKEMRESNQWELNQGEVQKRELNPTEAYLAGYESGIEIARREREAAIGALWRTPEGFYQFQEEWLKGINDGVAFVHNTRHPDNPIDLNKTESN